MSRHTKINVTASVWPVYGTRRVLLYQEAAFVE